MKIKATQNKNSVRSFLARIFISTFICLALSVNHFAKAQSDTIDQGPSAEETRKYIVDKLKENLATRGFSSSPVKYLRISLNGCTLIVEYEDTLFYSDQKQHQYFQMQLDQLSPVDEPIGGDGQVLMLHLQAWGEKRNTGVKTSYEDIWRDGHVDGDINSLTDAGSLFLYFPYRYEVEAARIARAFNHMAKLCGSKPPYVAPDPFDQK
jgi:hypothetical protein